MRSLRIVCSGLLAGIALAAVGPSLAITGGQSVAEALAAGEKDDGAAALASIARDVARYTVYVGMTDPRSGTGYGCTGVLVHPQVVLTAGHCLYGDGGVRLGLRVYFPQPQGARPVWRQSIDAAVHPRFAKMFDAVGARPRAGEAASRYLLRRGDFSPVDFALLLLHRAAPDDFSPVSPVAPGFRDAPGRSRVIAGYGQADGFAPTGQSTLRFADVRMAASPDSPDGALVIESRLGARGRVSACYGDSGGPVLVADSAGRWRLLGIHSAADRHCREEAWVAGLDRERAVLRSLFQQLTAGTPAATENPF